MIALTYPDLSFWYCVGVGLAMTNSQSAYSALESTTPTLAAAILAAPALSVAVKTTVWGPLVGGVTVPDHAQRLPLPSRETEAGPPTCERSTVTAGAAPSAAHALQDTVMSQARPWMARPAKAAPVIVGNESAGPEPGADAGAPVPDVRPRTASVVMLVTAVDPPLLAVNVINL